MFDRNRLRDHPPVEAPTMCRLTLAISWLNRNNGSRWCRSSGKEEDMDTTGNGEMKDQLARLGNAWAWIVAHGVASLLAGVVAVLWPSSTLVVIAIIFAAQLPVATVFTGIRRSADGACYGGGFHSPRLAAQCVRR
jgi:Flp pilus assembly protein TadB